jgi:hypothetical protein
MVVQSKFYEYQLEDAAQMHTKRSKLACHMDFPVAPQPCLVFLEYMLWLPRESLVLSDSVLKFMSLLRCQKHSCEPVLFLLVTYLETTSAPCTLNSISALVSQGRQHVWEQFAV